MSAVNYAKKCGQLIDRNQLNKFSKFAERKGGKLYIKIKPGKAKATTKVYENIFYKNFVKKMSPSEKNKVKITSRANEVISFYFYNFLKDQNLYLIWVLFWEGSQYRIIDSETGREYKVFEEPVFSSDKKHFISASFDIESGYRPNRIEIWEKTASDWRVVFKKYPGNTWGAIHPIWVDDKTVKLEKHGWLKGTGLTNPIGKTGSVLIKKYKSGWKLQQLDLIIHK